MRKIVLIALLATTAPMTAYAGGSVSCSGSSDGTVTCTVTYTW